MTNTNTNARIVKSKLGGDIAEWDKNLTPEEREAIAKRNADFNRKAIKRALMTPSAIMETLFREKRMIDNIFQPSSALFKRIEIPLSSLELLKKTLESIEMSRPHLKLFEEKKRFSEMSRPLSKWFEETQRSIENLRPVSSPFARMQLIAEQNIPIRHNTFLPDVSGILYQPPSKSNEQELVAMKEEVKEMRKEVKETRQKMQEVQDTLSAILEDNDGSQAPKKSDKPTEH